VASRFVPVPNLRELIETLPEVQEEVTDTAERVARRTLQNSKMAKRFPQRFGQVVVARVSPSRRRVIATGPLPHLEEWGSVNNPPRAPMRRAAEREGRFVVEGRHE
jgi:hypothetical protein